MEEGGKTYEWVYNQLFRNSQITFGSFPKILFSFKIISCVSSGITSTPYLAIMFHFFHFSVDVLLTESDSESIWREVVCMEDPIPIDTVSLETHFSQESVSRLKFRRSEVSKNVTQ